jgi:Heterokaryon incompatibility protein (HET)
MLCHKCKSIDWDQVFNDISFYQSRSLGRSTSGLEPRKGYKHHADLIALIESVKTGCKLCVEVLKAIRLEIASDNSLVKKFLTQIFCRVESLHVLMDDGYYKGVEELKFRFESVDPGQEDASVSVGLFIYPGDYTSHLFVCLSNFDTLTMIDNNLATYDIIGGRPLFNRLDSDESFDLARQWIKECIETHDNCPYDPSPTLPTRVIDVSPLGHTNTTCEPRLYISNDERSQYVALSHCWGNDPPFTTTTKSLADRMTGFAIADLPSTFKDAITITQRLGYRYLWIDSMCILQDSQEDWVRESQLMGEIYNRAVVTISAVAASEDKEGIFSAESEYEGQEENFEIPFVSQRHQCSGVVNIRPYFNMERMKGPLDQRAWTLQEEVLSPRTLYYCSDRLFWECQMLTFAEASVNAKNDNFAINSLKRGFILDNFAKSEKQSMLWPFQPNLVQWHNILTDYFERDITYDMDRLPAISAIAKVIHGRTGFNYRAGLWLEDMIIGLLWKPGDASPTSSLPTWSWISFRRDLQDHDEADLYYHLMLVAKPKHGTYEATILNCTVQLADNDPFGRVNAGSLTIRGKWQTIEGSICRKKYEEHFDELQNAEDLIRWLNWPSEQYEEYFDAPQEPEDLVPLVKSSAGPPNPKNVGYLLITRLEYIGHREPLVAEEDCVFWALILQEMDHKNNLYRRIGIARISDTDGQTENWEMRTVIIC